MGLNADHTTTRPFADAHPRPPGFDPSGRSWELCDGCRQCAEVCPVSAISFDAEGYPLIQTFGGACSHCGLCADSCTRGALDAIDVGALAGDEARWIARAALRTIAANMAAC